MKKNKALFYSLIILIYVIFLWLGFFIVPSLSEFQPGKETEQYQKGIANSYTNQFEQK